MNPSTETFNTEIVDSPSGARIVKMIGALTLRTLFDFQQTVRQETTKAVILDLSGVSYMDSAGLGSVISVFTSCQRNNRAFAVTGMNERINTLFAVTHVDGLLPCFATLPEAEASIAKHGA